MAKKPTAVDRVRLQESIVKAEKKETFPNRTALYTRVAEIYNRGYKDGPKITHSVVYLRVNEFGLTVKTPQGRVVVKKDPAPEPAPPPAPADPVRPKRGGGDPEPPAWRGPIAKIHTPSGEPPHRPTRLDKESVHSWCMSIRVWALARGMDFTPDAYIYWIRYYGPESFPREATMDRVTAWVHELYPPAVA